MLRNYLTVTLRTLRRHPGYTTINVLGLAVGLAGCLLLLLFVHDEQSYDAFHEKADRIYRVVRERQISQHEWSRLAATAWRVAPMLETTFPQIARSVRLSRQEMMVRQGETQQVEERFFLADSTFLEVFTFPLLSGDPRTALHEPFSVILTETTARRYFGEANPLGQTLTVDDQYEFTVTGLMRDVPRNAHFHFDFVASMQSAEIMWGANREMFESLGAVWLYTYVLLEPGTDISHLQQEINDFIQVTVASLGISQGYRFPLQHLRDIHLHSDYDNEIEANGDATTLYALAVIAVFILLIACINFMNLASARAAWRMKEVGVRKAVGAQRSHLIGQFLGEAVVLSLTALMLAVGLALLALPAFNAFTDKALSLSPHIPRLAAFSVLTVIVGLVAGSYPAFYLSAFKPASVLKGGRQVGGPRGATRLRHGLVVFQFAITIVLFISTSVVFQQLRYAQTKKLGFDKENVVLVRLNNDDARARLEQVRDAFAQLPGVAGVSAASNVPPDGLNTWGIDWDGAPEDLDLSIRVMAVDEKYLETLGLELVEGRNFSADRPSDATAAFLINETAAAQFGFTEPIGQYVRFPVNDRIVKEGEIIGVVRDFHLSSLHEPIQPVMLTLRPGWYGNLLVRLRPGAVPETLAQLEEQWKQVSPAWPFEYSFVDERLDQLYRPEQRTGVLFRAFSLLAIFVACLGLLGLAAFTAEKRTKEIGIRKVLGASVGRVVVLLTKDFLWLVVLAFLIAAPVAYFLMDRWLQDFAYRIDLSWPLFLMAGGLALLIAAFTVSYQSVKAALADPVRALRYE